MFAYLLVGTITGIVGAVIASNKARSTGGWFIFCFLVPLAVLIVLFLAPIKSKQKQAAPGSSEVDPIGDNAEFEEKWRALLMYDIDARNEYARVEALGPLAAAEMKRAFRVLGERAKLSDISSRIQIAAENGADFTEAPPPSGFVSINQYASLKGLEPDAVITMVRNGDLSGRYVDDICYVAAKELSDGPLDKQAHSR